MALQHVGVSSFVEQANLISAKIQVSTLSSGTIADDDHLFFWVVYPSSMTWTGPSGWALLRTTVGATRTVELWWRQWNTGDPTTWTMSNTGFNTNDQPRGLVTVFRGLQADPTVLSDTNQSTASPVTADAITDGSITNADWALGFFAARTTGILDPSTGTPTPDSYVILSGGGTQPRTTIAPSWRETGTTGSATAISIPVTGTVAETFGLQLILPSVPVSVGGWAVGMVRMGLN